MIVAVKIIAIRVFFIIVGLITSVVLVILMPGLLPGFGDTPSADNPEGAVELFWSSIDDGDYETASQYTTTDFDVEQATSDGMDYEEHPVNVRETNLRLKINGEARVRAVIVTDSEMSMEIREVVYELVEVRGTWKIESIDNDDPGIPLNSHVVQTALISGLRHYH
jgi:hypothetical protein